MNDADIILREIERRAQEYRKGAATYPNLADVADMMDDLADWIRARFSRESTTAPKDIKE